MLHYLSIRRVSRFLHCGAACGALLLLAGCGDLERVEPAAETPAPTATPAATIPQEPLVESTPEAEVPDVVPVVPASPVQAAEPASLKLAFWNIQWFPGNRPDATPEAEQAQIAMVQKELAEIAPDVLGMSEIRDAASANLAVAKLPGMTVDVVSRFPGREEAVGPQQLAIASEIPAMSAWNEQWKPARVQPPRGFAFTAYQVNARHVLLFYAVHLKSNWGERPDNYAMREESARQLLRHADAMRRTYASLGEVTVVFAGDFNTSLDDEVFRNENTLQLLLDAGYRWAWADVPRHERNTLPAGGMFPSTCFDHMFVSGPAEIESAFMPRTSHVSSDHRPVVTVLQFP